MQRVENMKLSTEEREQIMEVSRGITSRNLCSMGRRTFPSERECLHLSREDQKTNNLCLQGLRCNWSELQHQYQGLSLLTDTLPKKIRRTSLEMQLDELERFLALIEKHPVIIISDRMF